jgi:hypothetical protein
MVGDPSPSGSTPRVACCGNGNDSTPTIYPCTACAGTGATGCGRYLVNDKPTGIDPFQGDGKRLLDGSLFAPGGMLLIRGRV